MSRVAFLLLTLLLLGAGGGTARAAPLWTWPLSTPPGTAQPRVTRPFGLGPTVYAAGHRGADLAGEPGQAVLATGDGRVTHAGRLAGRGVVTVTHGTLRTTYEPVTATLRVGAQVAIGDPVGTLEPGHTGCPVAACLHWGLKRGDVYLDPLRLVQQRPVRLLTPRAGSTGSRGAEAVAASQVTAVENRSLRTRSPRSAEAWGREPDARASGPVVTDEPPDRRLAGGLTAGAAALVAAGAGSTVRRRDAARRSSGVDR